MSTTADKLMLESQKKHKIFAPFVIEDQKQSLKRVGNFFSLISISITMDLLCSIRAFFLILNNNAFKTKTLHLVLWKENDICIVINALIELFNYRFYTVHEKKNCTLIDTFNIYHREIMLYSFSEEGDHWQHSKDQLLWKLTGKCAMLSAKLVKQQVPGLETSTLLKRCVWNYSFFLLVRKFTVSTTCKQEGIK